MEKASVDGVLGIQIQDRWTVGADEPTELWQPHFGRFDVIDKQKYCFSNCPVGNTIKTTFSFSNQIGVNKNIECFEIFQN